jgi:hypothetical protein
MNRTHEDELIFRILQRARPTAQDVVTLPHLDEETLALFASGELTGDEDARAVKHMADCDDCREAASLLIVWAQDPPAVKSEPRVPTNHGDRRTMNSGFKQFIWFAATVAVCAVVAVGVWDFLEYFDNSAEWTESRVENKAEILLASKQFDRANDLLAQGQTKGLDSDRLRSQRSQAVRRLPGNLALASRGTFSDLGYNFDPTKGAGTGDQTVLSAADQLAAQFLEHRGNPNRDEDIELILNRGHFLLEHRDLEEALSEFEKATQLHPGEALGWLGRGSVRYAKNEFDKAEAAFRKCLELQPDCLAAAFNLAMTLEMKHKPHDALILWQSIDERMSDGNANDGRLSTPARAAVKQALIRLQ